MRTPLHNRRGALLIWALVLSFLLAMAALVVPNMILSRKSVVTDDRQRFEAYLLVSDVIEIGRYLLFYEKVFFKNDPLGLLRAGSTGTRGECLRHLWGQGLGSDNPVPPTNMMAACGRKGMGGVWMGATGAACGGGAISGDRATFCPYFIRSPGDGGINFEQTFYDLVASAGVLTKDGPGRYSLEIDLTSSFDPSASRQDELTFPLYNGQRFLYENFKSFLGKMNMKIVLRYDFYSPSSAFSSALSERYIKVSAVLTYTGANKQLHRVEKSEAMMMALSTPKDFALFFPFPDVGTPGVVTSEVTSVWSDAMEIATPTSVDVHGRVFFGGDLKADLDSLPIFHESVVISGNLRNSANKIYGPSDLDALKTKFKKGMVTNFNVDRYLLDGPCANATAATGTPATNVTIVNSTGMLCYNAAGARSGIVEYIGNQFSCSKYKATITSGGSSGSLLTHTLPTGTSDCAATLPFSGFLNSGYREVVANQNPTLLMGPIKRLTVPGDTSIYGTVFGGHLDVQGRANFYPVSMLKIGLPGIGNADTLSSLNTSSAGANAWVGIGILNMPVVMVTGDEGG